jgi:hypothetical protein
MESIALIDLNSRYPLVLENYKFLTPWILTCGLSVYAAKNSGDLGGFLTT